MSQIFFECFHLESPSIHPSIHPSCSSSIRSVSINFSSSTPANVTCYWPAKFKIQMPKFTWYDGLHVVRNVAHKVPKVAGINGRIRVFLEALDRQPGNVLSGANDARLDAVRLEDLEAVLEPQVRRFGDSGHLAEQIHRFPVVHERQTRGFVSEHGWRFVENFY